MLVSLVVSLFTTRIVFNTLGIDNFGIYNLVASIIVFFTFINNGLVNATRRYLTAELAVGNKDNLKNIFNLSIVSHGIISIVIFLLGETIGLWIVNGLLNIPEGRMFAANILYQTSILCAIAQIMQAPFTAVITAHEKMSVYAYFSIFDVFAKLLVAFLLLYIPGDSLIIYGSLLLLVAISQWTLYFVYCNKQFAETHYMKPHNKGLLKEMFLFMGWNLVGQGTVIMTNQGVTVLINMFFSVVANAAMGISNQITHIVTNFVNNFQVAFNPQITKLYVKQEYQELKKLAIRCSRFSIFLVLLFTIPIICQIETFLTIWLGEYPEYAEAFCIYTLISICIDSVSAPLWMILGSDKNIKKYQIIISCIYSISFFGGWLLLHLGYPPYSVIFVRCFVYVVSTIARLLLVKEKVQSFPVTEWIQSVCLNTLYVLAIPITTLYILSLFNIGNIYVELVSKAGLAFLSTSLSIYILGLTRGERQFINSKILKILKR